ncbi:MAG: right-handed parallel beta-helix repeat-containing protein [Planctomycetota bacterium]
MLKPESPCVDAGSDLAAVLGLDELTTSVDSSGDAGIVDMGFHYTVSSTAGNRHMLTLKVVGDGGTVDVIGEGGTPVVGGWLFDKFTVVKLLSTPDTGIRVRWIGTDDDGSEATSNTVTMDSDRTVTVEFTRVEGKTVTVPGDFPTIQQALDNATDGDTIVLDPGVHYGGGFSNPTPQVLLNQPFAVVVYKAVTITSRDPGDPNVVAATIIDGYRDINPYAYIGVLIGGSTGPDTVLDGITIQNCGGTAANGGDGDRTAGHPDGWDGEPLQGAAIMIENGASPIIRNCVIRDNIVRGGDGGNGENADDTFNAGRGGWAGWGRGGGAWCGPHSSPQFINCIFENNVARGGDAGNGGDSDTGVANYGGNYSRSKAFAFDPNALGFDSPDFVDGDLWEELQWTYAPVYGTMYGEPNLTSFIGDYRWYSGYGGGAYCDVGSNVTFVNCEIRGNQTFGGMSGIGGVIGGARNEEPLIAFEMPTYGAGVYCAADSTVTFTGCTFEDNVASGFAGTDPNHRLDPYAGYGGGVAAEQSAGVVFIDCNFVDNNADSGGAMYLAETDAAIIDCNVVTNTALRGGGLTSTDSAIDVIGTEIVANTATADPNDPNNAVGDILASGGGLYCMLGGLNVRDCNVTGNFADFSGGGAYLRDVNEAAFINDLFTNNTAGRDGAGLSANWFTDAIIANCTFVSNATPGSIGQTDRTGFGGGLFCSHETECLVTDSIFWENFALKGTSMAAEAGFEFDKRPSTITVTHSIVKDARAGIWLESGSTLNWDESNISDR